MFAAASRVLKGYNDDLAERALTQSKRLLKEATELMEKQAQSGNRRGGFGDIATYLELYVVNRGQTIQKTFEDRLWMMLDRNVSFGLLTALNAVPHMDASFKKNCVLMLRSTRTTSLTLRRTILTEYRSVWVTGQVVV